MRTAIVLVGGEAKRAGGREKYFFSLCGQTFIERLVTTLDAVVDEIIVVAKDPMQCARFADFHHVRVIPDIRTGIGPIGGLHAGVREARGELIFVVACDMPCVNAGVVDLLFSRINDYDAVIPTWNPEMLEPLHAVYRKDAVAAYLERHRSLSLRAMVRNLRALYLDVEEIRGIDPDLKTFTNINKIEELVELERLNGTGNCGDSTG